MTLYPDPFSIGVIDAELPWPACHEETLRGLPADDEYWQPLALEVAAPMRPRQYALTRAEMRKGEAA